MKNLGFTLLFSLTLLTACSQPESSFSYTDIAIHEVGATHDLELVWNHSWRLHTEQPATSAALAKLAEFHKKHPNYVFEIQRHTDHRGRDKSNLILSQKRAESVVLELVARHEVDPTKFQAKGYGETQPRISAELILTEKSKEAQEKLHRANMRTTVVLLKID